ncbi:PAS domain-containing sensor histidine kinase, partial [Ancylobacter sp. G4_0304]
VEAVARVTLSVVPASPNVVPLRSTENGRGDGARTSWEGLSNGERNAFREIARALGARLEGVDDEPPAESFAEPDAVEPLADEPVVVEPNVNEPEVAAPP